MSSTKISIITPSFNRANIIDETATSIFNQSSDDWEWVIVDDGSTDNSWELLQSYAKKDNRVKIHKRDREPKGACTCRNIAVEKCTGDYVMFLDTDDVLAPFCIEQRLSTIKEYPKCDFVVFSMLLFEKKLEDLNLLWNIDNGENDLSRVLIGDPVCQGTGPLWKKQSFVEVGMWREDLKLWQDVELHIRSFLKPVEYVKRLDLKPDVYLRESYGSLSRGAYNSIPKLTSRIEVFKYAIKTIIDKGLLDKYQYGIRVMGTDVIVSAIKARMHKDVNELFNIVERADLYSNQETKYLSRFRKAQKNRLYKIPVIYKPIHDKVMSIVGDVQTSLVKVKYEPIK